MCLLVLVCYTTRIFGATTEPAREQAFDSLIHSIQVDDRNAFVADATDDMKQAITPQIMSNISHDISHDLIKGFQATYLGELKQQGCMVQIWKVTFKDGRDDMLAQVSMRGDKLAGFFIQ
jgi:hypothetical protein